MAAVRTRCWKNLTQLAASLRDATDALSAFTIPRAGGVVGLQGWRLGRGFEPFSYGLIINKLLIIYPEGDTSFITAGKLPAVSVASSTFHPRE